MLWRISAELTEEVWQMNPDGRPASYKPECRKLAQDYCLLVATNEDLATVSEVTRPHYRMPQRAEDRYHRAAFSARCPGPHLLAAQPAAPELEPQAPGLAVGSGYRGLLETADEGARPVAQWPRRPSGRGPEANPRHRCREAPVPRHPPACSAKALATLTNDNAGCPSSATRVLPSRVFEWPSPWLPDSRGRDEDSLDNHAQCYGLTVPASQERIGIMPIRSNGSDISHHGQPPMEVGPAHTDPRQRRPPGRPNVLTGINGDSITAHM